MSLSQWQCRVCTTHFSRSEHLRRHLRSHENKRPYECTLCQRSFTRRDAKTRHEKTCKAQQPSKPCLEDVPSAAAPVMVTGNELYGGTEAEMALNMPYSLDFTALDWLYSTRMNSDNIITAERLDFLARFTSENGMGTFLAPETLTRRQDMILEHENTSQPPIPAASFSSSTIEPSILHVNTDINPLTTRTFEIIHHFHSIITRKPNRNVVTLVWSKEVEALCRSFFEPSNITRFLGYFWSLWYPNCPIIHRASFDPLKAPVALLCVMIMIGACLSPHTNDGNIARIWLDCAEELAFEEGSFEKSTRIDMISESLGQCSSLKKKRLEQLQTLYLVCSLQKREGSIEARARIRRYRHATMVKLAREIGLATGTRRNLDLEHCSETWWYRFAVQEELIRTMTYVFLFDAAFTIFHNSPPRMVVSELKVEMACPEACFQALSAEECFDALKQSESTVFWKRHLSIVALVKSICQKDMSAESIDEYSKVGSLNLFTVVQSLHSLTFHLQNSIIFESTLLPIKTGLKNWRLIWNKRESEDQFIPDGPETLWKKVGFMGYSAEFWQLARIIVERIHEDGGDTDEGFENDSVDITNLKKSRYDHTDMSDVNGLIMEYRRMSLGAAG